MPALQVTSVSSIAYSPNGNQLAAGGYDNEVTSTTKKFQEYTVIVNETPLDTAIRLVSHDKCFKLMELIFMNANASSIERLTTVTPSIPKLLDVEYFDVVEQYFQMQFSKPKQINTNDFKWIVHCSKTKLCIALQNELLV